MNSIEKKLSDYIDQLNSEKKPKEHESSTNSPELEKLMDTVRLVRSLKKPALPGPDYPKKIAHTVVSQLSEKATIKKQRRAWFAGVAAVAAIAVMAVVLNFMSPLGRTNIVYAMEQAFQGVKAYHGILEIVETNAEGKETAQTKLEVWADKKGHYYVKEIEGLQKGLVTINNGQKKWQIRPDHKEIIVFPAFPDPYRFTFELGKEIEEVKNAVETKTIGEDSISGRKASILEVSPKGGIPYRVWIDKETKLPLRRQSSMQNALQYTATYTNIDFSDNVPAQLVTYNPMAGFKEIDTNPEQLVNNIEEAGKAAGFTPKLPDSIPVGYNLNSISVETTTKTIKLHYTSQDKQNRVIILQGKLSGEFKPASTAVLGKVNDSMAEIQSPIEGSQGILAGGGPYAGMTNISSIRWQGSEFEYAVIGNTSLEELTSFVEALTHEVVKLPLEDSKLLDKPKIEVPVDLKVEENDQKSVDGGHSPWKLDPLYVAQVFVSLKISPEGIQGEYPIKYEDLKTVLNTGKDVVVEISGDKTPIRKVYLKRLVRQDNTGIWTVVGYDPVDKR